MYGNSLFKWVAIWINITSKFIQVNKREIIFKYMHEILSTRKRIANSCTLGPFRLKGRKKYTCIIKLPKKLEMSE